PHADVPRAGDGRVVDAVGPRGALRRAGPHLRAGPRVQRGWAPGGVVRPRRHGARPLARCGQPTRGRRSVTDAVWDRERMVITDIGFMHRGAGDDVVGELDVQPSLCIPGTSAVRPSVLATVADVLTGVLASVVTQPRVAMTADLTVQTLAGLATD